VGHSTSLTLELGLTLLLEELLDLAFVLLSALMMLESNTRLVKELCIQQWRL
jgi:hypothetical protein